MAQRLPTLGESPYKTILDGFLAIVHNADGTLKTNPATSIVIGTATGSTVAVNALSAATAAAAIVGQATAYYAGQFFNITDAGSDLANANQIGLVGQSVYANAMYAQQGAVSGSGSTLARNNIYPGLYVTRVVASLNGFNYTAPVFRIDDTTASTGDLLDIKRGVNTVARMLTSGKFGIDASGGSIGAPAYALDVKGASSVAAVIRGFGSATSNACQIRIAGRQDGELWAIGIDIDGAGSGARPFQIYDLVAGNATLSLAGSNAAIGGAISTTTFLLTPASTTAASSIRAPHGAAPAAPVNGDIWTTTAGLFVRVNGATVGPLS